MAERVFIGRRGFWPLALLWLPAGVVATAVVRLAPESGTATGPGPWLPMVLMMAGSLVLVARCGVPLALDCRRIWRLGYRRGAWLAGMGSGAVTVVAGPLGPVAIAVYVVRLSLPVWIAWWWL